ncbi:MAG: amidohydrolase family protein [Pseudomonadota bacterium]
MSNRSAAPELWHLAGGLTLDGPQDLLIEGSNIAAVGHNLVVPAGAQRLDLTGKLLWPGLVNTHHHLAQTLLKGVPAALSAPLADWLPAVPYTAWPLIDADALYAAARLGLYELLRAGCTTCADHHYLYAATTSEEIEAALWQAADDLGMRLVLCRGGAVQSKSHPGMRRSMLQPESQTQWLERLEATVRKHHDPAPDARERVVVAPTSLVHGAPPALMRELGDFARRHKLRRHSHLLEVAADNEAAMALHGFDALDYADEIGWLEDDVWYAHLVHLKPEDLPRLARRGVGLAHCPTSNCRLGSGIAPAPALDAAGANVSLGVDGAASAEPATPLSEMSLAWLLHRAIGGSAATDAHQIAHWATAGGARVLGLNTGRLAAGCAADLAIYDLEQPRLAGLWAPELAPVLCGEPLSACDVMVHGRWVLRDGALPGTDTNVLHQDAARARKRLQQRWVD